MADAPDGEPDPTANQPPARRRVWRWLAVLGGLALVALLGYAGWLYVDNEQTARSGAQELAAARARVAADDPDWTWERLSETRPRPPAKQNGAALIPQIKKNTHADWGKALQHSELVPQLDIPPNVRYGPEILSLVLRDLSDSVAAVRLAVALKDRPFGHRDIDLKPDVFSTLLPDTQNTRQAADLLRWEVVAASEDGDGRRTADALLALVNASRSIGDEPFLISQLVRIAVRAVAVRSAERAVAQSADLPLAELQAALAADADEPLLLYGLRGERAGFDQLFENLQTGAVRLEDLTREIGKGKPDFWEFIKWRRYRSHLRGERADLLLWMTRHIDAARRPAHEQPALIAAIPQLPADEWHYLSRALTPAIEKVAQASWRGTAEARCAAAGLACERFRQKHNRWPDALADLAPEFLPAVPLDPFGGGPLGYRKLDDGVVVFSAGKHAAGAYAHAGMPAGIDYGFRLWNPDRRRLPSPPPDAPVPEGEPPP